MVIPELFGYCFYGAADHAAFRRFKAIAAFVFHPLSIGMKITRREEDRLYHAILGLVTVYHNLGL